jgi:dienelactone hydrolase
MGLVRRFEYSKLLSMALAAGLLALAAAPAAAQPAAERPWLTGAARDYRAPEDIDFRPLRLISEGVMLHAEHFSLRAARGKKLPVVIMGHGWGGTSAVLRADAEDLARAGFLVITFDYRGWGESDGRVTLVGPAPSGRRADAQYTTGVKELRGYIDPFEQAEDWFNVISFVQGYEMADPARIGLRGTSLSGGEVLYVAALDERVKAVVSQAPRIDFGPGGKPNPGAEPGHEAAIKLTQGEATYPEPRAKVVGSLTGAPVGDKFSRWRPGAYAAQVTAPVLFVLADKEALVDNAANGERAFKAVKAKKKLVVLPGPHGAVYGDQRAAAVKAAADWFTENLK